MDIAIVFFPQALRKWRIHVVRKKAQHLGAVEASDANAVMQRPIGTSQPKRPASNSSTSTRQLSESGH
jgi:hypothetical protein